MTRESKIALLGVLAGAGLFVGCATKPERKPQILNTYPPPGAPQSAPLGSRHPIQVPSAPVGQTASVRTSTVQPIPAVATPPPGTLLVPVAPQPGAYLNTPQPLPAQPGAYQPPATGPRSGSDPRSENSGSAPPTSSAQTGN